MSAPGPIAKLRRPLVAVVTIVAALGLVASCGVREDDTPRALAAEALPPELSEPTPSTSVTGSATTRQVFMVQTRPSGEEVLVTVPIPVEQLEGEDIYEEVLTALVQHAPGRDATYSNAIPATTGVLDVQLVDDGDGVEDILQINLNALDVTGGQLKLAVAQMVFTATTLSGVQGVRFKQNGDPVAVPLDGGESEVGQVVTRADFPDTDPSRATSTTTTIVPVEPVEPGEPAEPIPADIGAG